MKYIPICFTYHSLIEESLNSPGIFTIGTEKRPLKRNGGAFHGAWINPAESPTFRAYQPDRLPSNERSVDLG